MPNNWGIGRTGQVYVKDEASYGTAPTLAATDAFRHLSVSLPYNPRNRVNSPERHTHPSQLVRYTRRATASFDVKGMLYPSGTLNTLPEANVFLKNGMGAAPANITLATTVAASPAPTTTGATVASAAGLVVGQGVLITIAAGAFAGSYARVLTGISTLALTWTPALPAVPVTGDALVGAVTYRLATLQVPTSMDIAAYSTLPATVQREQLGCVADKLTLTFDSNSEPMISVAGPAKGQAASAQAQPGAFTTVGLESGIPSGLTGGLRLGAAELEFLKAEFTITNAMDLQNNAFGTSSAQAAFRKNKRVVEVSIDTMVSDQLALYTAGRDTTDQTVLVQCGLTPGKIWAVYCPAVEFEYPDTPDSEETAQWAAKGIAKGVTGNDEVVLVMA